MSNYHTLLGQMLQMFSGFDFQKTVSETKTEEAGLATHAQSLYHLGIKPIHRSTLSYANQHRSHERSKDLETGKIITVLTNNFARRNLWDWLNAPFQTSSHSSPEDLQLKLAFC